jgi:upstream activation factor subunit UAF30
VANHVGNSSVAYHGVYRRLIPDARRIEWKSGAARFHDHAAGRYGGKSANSCCAGDTTERKRAFPEWKRLTTVFALRILSLSRLLEARWTELNVTIRLEDSSMAAKKAKKAAKKPAARKSKPMKKAATKRAAPKAKKPAAKRKPNAAFMKPMTISSTLAQVIGSNPMPRTEVTSKLWGYIKKNNLQDKTNRRMINADDKLREVFGGKRQVSMFEMTKLVSKHLK